jgi:nitrogen fixation/metabolism regulation signal transduction histidine kinase
MGFNLRVLLHIFGIQLTVTALAWCLTSDTSYYATMFTLSLLLLMQLAALVRYISHTNRELTRFLAAVQHGDFSQSFRGSYSHSSFRELGTAFDAVLERLRRERGDKETQASYLQAFVQQLPIPVFCLHEDEHITLGNLACLRLLGLKELNHLRQLTDIDTSLSGAVCSLEPGHEQHIKVQRLSTALDLRLSCTLLRSKGQLHKLISLLDIRSALESRELEAWHNLIRVMTHEIMNSITPLTSLASTAHGYITEAREQLQQPDNSALATLNLLEDAASATATIGKRGSGLMRFVESYRTLTRIPPPRPIQFAVANLLKSVQELLQQQAQQQNVQLQFCCDPENMTLFADIDLLEQALLNLVKNAFDAVATAESPLIRMTGKLDSAGTAVIEVSDNGSGIPPDILESIFIPFFTTKRGGSGIGLSLVKQIVQLNGGRIEVASVPGTGTTFTLTFR